MHNKIKLWIVCSSSATALKKKVKQPGLNMLNFALFLLTRLAAEPVCQRFQQVDLTTTGVNAHVCEAFTHTGCAAAR